MSSNWRMREETLTVSALGRLIAHLALDEELHRRFLEEPNPVIAEAGLEEEEEQALRDGDWVAIRELLGPRPRPLPKEPPSSGGGLG